VQYLLEKVYKKELFEGVRVLIADPAMLRIERISSSSQTEFDQLVLIYAGSLAASERKSVAALQEMLARPEYLFLAAIERERVVGFAIAIALIGSDAALLEYMAVDAEFRGRGVGVALFGAVADWQGIADRFLLVEVDSEHEDSAERQERARRKAFYRGLGAQELGGLRYIMPPVTAATPPPMDLMAYRRELPGCLEKERVRGWLEACYGQVYGVAAGDPRIDAMLGGCAECIPLIC
jgi:GNAT superfamily N-acetyltransferase